MKKKILVTGNLGYIGSVLVPMLSPKYKVAGYDIGYYKNCNLVKINKQKNFKQVIKDIRNIEGISQVSLSGFPDEEIEISLTE